LLIAVPSFKPKQTTCEGNSTGANEAPEEEAEAEGAEEGKDQGFAL
jgi:hypothetical protein